MSEIEKIEFENGDVYEGEIKDGKPHGKGTMQFNNEWGTIYVGDWVNGVRTGQGTSIKKNGNRYVGEFLNDELHGKGFLIDEGTVFEGEFVNGYAPKIPTRFDTGHSILPEDGRQYMEKENYPRVSVFKDIKKKRAEYDLEQGWTVETLKVRLKDKFRNQIDKYEVFVMSPYLEMSEEDFKRTFEEFCKENNRKGHFEESVYGTPSFVFEDGKTGFQIFADKEKEI